MTGRPHTQSSAPGRSAAPSPRTSTTGVPPCSWSTPTSCTSRPSASTDSSIEHPAGELTARPADLDARRGPRTALRPRAARRQGAGHRRRRGVDRAPPRRRRLGRLAAERPQRGHHRPARRGRADCRSPSSTSSPTSWRPASSTTAASAPWPSASSPAATSDRVRTSPHDLRHWGDAGRVRTTCRVPLVEARVRRDARGHGTRRRRHERADRPAPGRRCTSSPRRSSMSPRPRASRSKGSMRSCPTSISARDRDGPRSRRRDRRGRRDPCLLGSVVRRRRDRRSRRVARPPDEEALGHLARHRRAGSSHRGADAVRPRARGGGAARPAGAADALARRLHRATRDARDRDERRPPGRARSAGDRMSALTDQSLSPLVDAAEDRRATLVADLTAYAEQETPSDDLAALAEGLAWVRAYVASHLGAADAERTVARRAQGDIAVLDFEASAGGTGQVAILCHYDTVWPFGTLADWPVTIDGDRLTGPGVFDMKAGLVQVTHAIAIARSHGLPCPRPAGAERRRRDRLARVAPGDRGGGRPASMPCSSSRRAQEARSRPRERASVCSRSRPAASRATPDSIPRTASSAIDEMAHVIVALHGSADLAAGHERQRRHHVGRQSRSNVTAGARTASSTCASRRGRDGADRRGLRRADPAQGGGRYRGRGRLEPPRHDPQRRHRRPVRRRAGGGRSSRARPSRRPRWAAPATGTSRRRSACPCWTVSGPSATARMPATSGSRSTAWSSGRRSPRACSRASAAPRRRPRRPRRQAAPPA